MIVLLPSLLYAPVAEVFVVVVVCLLLIATGIFAQLRFRTASNLSVLRRIVTARTTIKEFSAQEYLAKVGLTQVPPVERHGRLIEPSYRILRIPRHIGYNTYQYLPLASFVLVPFPPDGLKTPGQLSAFLHELGHIGKKNLLNATAHAVYEVEITGGPGKPPTVPVTMWENIRAVWSYGKRGLKRFQGVETIIALAGVNVFIHDLGPIENMVIMLTTNFAASWRISGTRIEAEIEADHYQMSALTWIPRDNPIFAGQRGQALPTERPEIRDKFMNAPDNWARNETLARMQDDAAEGRLQTCEYYLWHKAWGADVFMTLQRILFFVVCAAIVGVHAIEIMPWLLAVYGVVCAVLVAWSVWKRRRSLRQLNAAIAERREPSVTAMAIKRVAAGA